VAIDDFSFTPSCRVNTVEKLPSYFFTTPTPDLTCGSPNQFRCKASQECISMDMLCNFRYDCQDKSDEDFCPWTCNFDSMLSTRILHFYIFTSDNTKQITIYAIGSMKTKDPILSQRLLGNWELDRRPKQLVLNLVNHFYFNLFRSTFNSKWFIIIYEDHTTNSPNGYFLYLEYKSFSFIFYLFVQ